MKKILTLSLVLLLLFSGKKQAEKEYVDAGADKNG